jgi:hypothetical protein
MLNFTAEKSQLRGDAEELFYMALIAKLMARIGARPESP